MVNHVFVQQVNDPTTEVFSFFDNRNISPSSKVSKRKRTSDNDHSGRSRSSRGCVLSVKEGKDESGEEIFDDGEVNNVGKSITKKQDCKANSSPSSSSSLSAVLHTSPISLEDASDSSFVAASPNSNDTSTSLYTAASSLHTPLKLSDFEALEKGCPSLFTPSKQSLAAYIDEDINALRQKLKARYIELSTPKPDINQLCEPVLSLLPSVYTSCVEDVNVAPSNFLTHDLPELQRQLEEVLSAHASVAGEEIVIQSRRLLVTALKNHILISPKDLAARRASTSTSTTASTLASVSPAATPAVLKMRECEIQILLLMEIFGWDQKTGEPKDPLPGTCHSKLRSLLGTWNFSFEEGISKLLEEVIMKRYGKTHPLCVGALFQDFDQKNPTPSVDAQQVSPVTPNSSPTSVSHSIQKRQRLAKERLSNLPVGAVTNFTAGLVNVKRLFRQIPISKTVNQKKSTLSSACLPSQSSLSPPRSSSKLMTSRVGDSSCCCSGDAAVKFSVEFIPESPSK